MLAWRTGGKPQHEEKPDEVLGTSEAKKKGVTFAGEVAVASTANKGAFSFFAGLGNNDFDFDVMPSWTEGGTAPMETEAELKTNKPKNVRVTCY